MNAESPDQGQSPERLGRNATGLRPGGAGDGRSTAGRPHTPSGVVRRAHELVRGIAPERAPLRWRKP
jgi:hypothetical protein